VKLVRLNHDWCKQIATPERICLATCCQEWSCQGLDGRAERGIHSRTTGSGALNETLQAGIGGGMVGSNLHMKFCKQFAARHLNMEYGNGLNFFAHFLLFFFHFLLGEHLARQRHTDPDPHSLSTQRLCQEHDLGESWHAHFFVPQVYSKHSQGPELQ
jgi:hypothetical protein